MTVLKGNTAGALYGYRADNGVILVTTKKGKSGSGINVDFNSNIQFESILNQRDFQQQYGHGNRGAKPIDGGEGLEYGLQSWGAAYDGSSVPQFDGVSRPYSYSGDNMSRFYDTGTTWTNTLALSGGGEGYGFRLSGTNLANKGVVPNSSVDRRSFTANINAQRGIFFGNISGSFINDDTRNRLTEAMSKTDYLEISLWELSCILD